MVELRIGKIVPRPVWEEVDIQCGRYIVVVDGLWCCDEDG